MRLLSKTEESREGRINARHLRSTCIDAPAPAPRAYVDRCSLNRGLVKCSSRANASPLLVAAPEALYTRTLSAADPVDPRARARALSLPTPLLAIGSN